MSVFELLPIDILKLIPLGAIATSRLRATCKYLRENIPDRGKPYRTRVWGALKKWIMYEVVVNNDWQTMFEALDLNCVFDRITFELACRYNHVPMMEFIYARYKGDIQRGLVIALRSASIEAAKWCIENGGTVDPITFVSVVCCIGRYGGMHWVIDNTKDLDSLETALNNAVSPSTYRIQHCKERIAKRRKIKS